MIEIWRSLQFTRETLQASLLVKGPRYRSQASLDLGTLRITIEELLSNPDCWPVGVGIVVHESTRQSAARIAYRSKFDPTRIVIYEEVFLPGIIEAAGPPTVTDLAHHQDAVVKVLVPLDKADYAALRNAMEDAASRAGLSPDQVALVVSCSPVNLTKEAGEEGKAKWMVQEGRARRITDELDFDWLLERVQEDPLCEPEDMPFVVVINTTKINVPPVSKDRLGQ